MEIAAPHHVNVLTQEMGTSASSFSVHIELVCKLSLGDAALVLLKAIFFKIRSYGVKSGETVGDYASSAPIQCYKEPIKVSERLTSGAVGSEILAFPFTGGSPMPTPNFAAGRDDKSFDP